MWCFITSKLSFGIIYYKKFYITIKFIYIKINLLNNLFNKLVF